VAGSAGPAGWLAFSVLAGLVVAIRKRRRDR
jgi:MYXO-CTERM domain-containing protein